MTNRRTATRLALLATAAWLAATPAGGAPAKADPDPAPATGSASEVQAYPRDLMREIFEALAVVLPRSMDTARFADPAQHDRIRAALKVLSEDAGQLEQHGAHRGPGFQHLAKALGRDARDAYQRFDRGRFDEAAFLVQQLSENCLACHARLPANRDAPLGDRLVREMDLEGLALPERARLQMATRQFSGALDTWEELFRSPEVTPGRLDIMGYLGDYLTVCIRVSGDSKRALKTLRSLAARDDVPDWVAKDLAVWISTLEDLEARGLVRGGSNPLESARQLLSQAETVREHPADHTGLIHDLVASSLLYRYTEARPWGGPDVAEAYYLLGVAESRVTRSYWITQADFYLETSIRMAPGGPFAEPALDLLAERTVQAYTGSSGTHIPSDVQKDLDELRDLVERSQPAQEG